MVNKDYKDSQEYFEPWLAEILVQSRPLPLRVQCAAPMPAIGNHRLLNTVFYRSFPAANSDSAFCHLKFD